jgi:hypothetical protein
VGEQMFMMKSEVVGLSSVRSDLAQSVDQRICERQRFTISEPSCEFPQISCIVLHEIITVRLGCHHKFCTSVLKMLKGVKKPQRTALDLTFLEQYHKDGEEFLNHMIRVTGEET